MTVLTNEHGQPVGDPVPAWTGCTPPAPVTLVGRWVRLEPLEPRHAPELYDATCGRGREPLWTYLADEMPASPTDFASYVDRRLAAPMVSLVVVPGSGSPQGLVSLLRADPAQGSVEVGSIVLGPRLQRTTAATEAMWLLAQHVFALGHRRYEWKCDALNAPSRAAATRLGFRHEGTFRQAVVYKGRNRDTAWYSMTDDEGRGLAPAYDRWLDPANFDDPTTGGGQRTALSSLTAPA